MGAEGIWWNLCGVVWAAVDAVSGAGIARGADGFQCIMGECIADQGPREEVRTMRGEWCGNGLRKEP